VIHTQDVASDIAVDLALSLPEPLQYVHRFQSTFQSPVFQLDSLEAGTDVKIYLYAENSKG
jgi:hypothetical protein